MIYAVIVLCFILFCIALYNFLTRNWVNPWTLSMVFGKKGAGKTTHMAKMAIIHAMRGWTVYSTVALPFTYAFDPNDLGVYETPANLQNPFTEIRLPDSDLPFSRKMKKRFDKIMSVKPNGNVLILCDEVGMIWDNRNFKQFRDSTRDWFKLQRHRQCKCYLYSQTFDVDIKIRTLCDDMWLITKKFRVFSYGKHIIRKLDIIEATGDSESRIVDNLAFDSFLWFWAGSRSLIFLPSWVGLFDSYEAPKLKDKKYKFYPFSYLVALPPASAEEADDVFVREEYNPFEKHKPEE